MRYLLAENTYVLGRFDSGLGVTLTLYDISTGSSVALDTNGCTELGITGYYQWYTDEITTPPVVRTEYLWVMTDGATEKAGKIILGGYPDDIKDQTDQMNFNGDNIQARVADKGVLNNPPSENINDYKATGFSVPNEYDAALATIQTDLDNPDQYKADVSALALESTAQDVKSKTDNLPSDPADQSQVEAAITASIDDIVDGVWAHTSAIALQSRTEDMLGIQSENAKWSAFNHDSNHNLTSAIITQYEDNTLTVIRQTWEMNATYDANSELTSYQTRKL